MENDKEYNLFVPGRLCLFGEHSDWAGALRIFNSNIGKGEAIVTGIEQGIYGTVKKSNNFILRNEWNNQNNNIFFTDMNQNTLRDIAKEGGYYSYVAGVASYMLENYHVKGIEICINKCTLPIKRGLSSSAAICVLVARAFNKVYNLNLSIRGEMQVAYLGEQRTPSRCGRLDQACAFGTKPVHMEFDGNELESTELSIGATIHLVFADLMSEKDTIKILSDLNKCYPYAQTELDHQVHKALGIENQIIIQKAKQYIENGNLRSLGELMTIAQKNFDFMVAPASPMELKAPKLHSVLEDSVVKKLTYGGKGVGSHGDGSVQFLAKNKECQDELKDYLFNKLKLNSYACTLKANNKVNKAIIPLAGCGTRLFPATKAIRKEFMPIIDRCGVVKPMLLILLEELNDAGIEKIYLVINQSDQIFYDKFFNDSSNIGCGKKLTSKMAKYDELILSIRKKVEYVYQNKQKGLGHAVNQCKNIIGNNPVLVALGDTFYRSKNGLSCTEQLLNVFQRINMPVISIHSVPIQDVPKYGILSGEWDDHNQKILDVKKFIEKPSIEYAEEHLVVENKKKENGYYSVFGEYIMTPEVFDILDQMVKKDTSQSEIQLTSAFNEAIYNYGLKAFRVDGEMFDIGNPSVYYKTIRKYYDE